MTKTRLIFITLAAVHLLLLCPGLNAGTTAHSHHGDVHHHPDHDQSTYVRSVHVYALPDVSLVTKDGNKVSLGSELNSGVPTLLNFIFTSCTAICPIMTSTFSQIQDKLAGSSTQFKMVSISIDPEQDTPEKLKMYADNYQAGSNWDFLTGELAAIWEIQRAFDAYRGNKANHVPITFMRAKNTDPWVRLEGFTSAKELIGEYQKLVLN